MKMDSLHVTTVVFRGLFFIKENQNVFSRAKTKCKS